MPLFQPHIDALSAGTTSVDYGTVVFSNSNGMSFGMAGNTITGSYTVPTATNATLSAGTQSTIITSIVFSNSNNFSFGLSNNTITASYTVPAVTNSSASISAGASSETLSNLVFSNSNGISFGLNAGTITGTVQTNYLTTAMLSNAGSNFVNTSAGVNLTNISATFNSNSISLSVGNYITTAMASNRGSDFVQATAVFNGTNASGTIASNSWSVSVAAQTNQTVGLYASSNTYLTSSGTVNATALSFRGDKSITVGISGGEVAFSVGAYLTTAMASAAGSNFVNTSAGVNLTNISATFNSNSISLSVGNYITTAMASNRGSDFVQATAVFNGTNASGTIASNAISISVANPSGLTNINVSAGTTSNNLSNIIFSNSNGMSFGLNGSTVTASYSTNEATLSFLQYPDGALSINATRLDQQFLFISPIVIPQQLSATVADLLINVQLTTSGANNSTYSGGFTFSVGLYSLSAGTLNLASSSNQTYSYSYTSDGRTSLFSGNRKFTIPININASPGNWWYGLIGSVATSSGSITLIPWSGVVNSSMWSGPWGSAHNNSTNQLIPYQGLYSATTAAFPASISISQIYAGTGQGTVRAIQPIYIQFRNISIAP